MPMMQAYEHQLLKSTRCMANQACQWHESVWITNRHGI